MTEGKAEEAVDLYILGFVWTNIFRLRSIGISDWRMVGISGQVNMMMEDTGRCPLIYSGERIHGDQGKDGITTARQQYSQQGRGWSWMDASGRSTLHGGEQRYHGACDVKRIGRGSKVEYPRSRIRCKSESVEGQHNARVPVSTRTKMQHANAKAVQFLATPGMLLQARTA